MCAYATRLRRHGVNTRQGENAINIASLFLSPPLSSPQVDETVVLFEPVWRSRELPDDRMRVSWRKYAAPFCRHLVTNSVPMMRPMGFRGQVLTTGFERERIHSAPTVPGKCERVGFSAARPTHEQTNRGGYCPCRGRENTLSV